jgi:hypothetical protein
MTSRIFANLLRFSALALAMTILAPALRAQGPLPDAPTPTHGAEPAATAAFIAPTITESKHKFWDAKNSALFATAFAFDGADFAVTRMNLQNGGRELNPMVRVFGRSTAGLAANFAGEGIGTVALSYFFHRTGHHKMERMVSVVNIGGSATAVGYGLAHR